MNRLCLIAALVATATLTAASAHAQDVSGVYMRLKTEKSGVAYFELSQGNDGKVSGTRLKVDKALTFTLDLALEGDALDGTHTVEEADYDPIVMKWEFKVGERQLKGRSEWVAWDEEGNESRGWEDYTLVRLERVGLVSDGVAEAGASGSVDDLAGLAGGWAGEGGLAGAWTIKVDGGEASLAPVGHHDGVLIKLRSDGGVLKGSADLGGGNTSQVELGFSDGKLAGRSEWVAGNEELGDQAQRGWSPIGFTRLERLEAGPADASAEAPPAGGDDLVGVYKRDDGLYVRVRREGNDVVGTLSDAEGAAKARLSFTLEGGVWKGLANWGELETRWELSVTDAGVVGRSEWVDLHEGAVVARGWTGRTFTKLERVH